MNRYIICTDEDWADEFSYPIISVCTKEELEEAKKIVSEWPTFKQRPTGYDRYARYEFGFGTNEWFEFTQKEIMELLDSAKEITIDELAVLYKFQIWNGTYGMGCDIIAQILESVDWEESDD